MEKQYNDLNPGTVQAISFVGKTKGEVLVYKTPKGSYLFGKVVSAGKKTTKVQALGRKNNSVLATEELSSELLEVRVLMTKEVWEELQAAAKEEDEAASA